MERQKENLWGKKSCYNCFYLEVKELETVECEHLHFWNKFREEEPNLMKLITVKKKGERYAKNCPDFIHKREKILELRRTKVLI